MKKEKWWKDLYGDLLADFLLDTTSNNELVETVDFFVKYLGLKPGDRVFDQCCGTGWLSLALAERGFHLIGVDLIEGYINRGRISALEKGISVDFFQGDAFEFVASPECDGVFNWWTSFGYASEDTENAEMLLRAFESLKSGGRFALDFMNTGNVIKYFQPYVVNRLEKEEGEFLMIRESQLDLAGGKIFKDWTFVSPEGDREIFHSEVRLYGPHELVRLFEDVGFENIEVFGDTNGASLTIESNRCIVTGRRPE